jgi:very-short-patch-repair endonuclease
MKAIYKKSTKRIAKVLRKNLTPWEKRFWFEFARNYQYNIYRQRPVGRYVLDFYCARAKIAIELDGSGHSYPFQIKKDQERTSYLENLGVKVLRFSNERIALDFDEVCKEIDAEIQQRVVTPQSKN